MKLESNTKLLPTDPIFSFHSKWRFRLSSIALSSLADAYGKTVTQMRGQSINATHFLKMAAAAKKALRAEEKTKAAEKKVPKAVQARKDWQDESLQKLHNERDIVLQPLQEHLQVRPFPAALRCPCRCRRTVLALYSQCPCCVLATGGAVRRLQGDACEWLGLYRTCRPELQAAGGVGQD